MSHAEKSMVINEEATEVISFVEGGLELHEEYFHSKAELSRVLREFGFTGEFGESAAVA